MNVKKKVFQILSLSIFCIFLQVIFSGCLVIGGSIIGAGATGAIIGSATSSPSDTEEISTSDIQNLNYGTECQVILKNHDIVKGKFEGIQYWTYDSDINLGDSIFFQFKSTEHKGIKGIFLGFDPDDYLIYLSSDKRKGIPLDRIIALKMQIIILLMLIV